MAAVNLDDTIVAVATPAGRGGIGVVRLSGPESLSIAQPMLRLKRELEAGRAVFGELIDSGANDPAIAVFEDPVNRIDEVVVTYFAKPHSYTAEDVVEIAAHGSPVVLRHVVEMAIARGARLAEPGEFTMRAFLNGRIDLAQAEAVRDLIESQTLYQAQVAAQQLNGALSRRLNPIKQQLVELIAALEAGIDFAEDDISVLPSEQILQRLAGIQAPLETLAASFAFGKLVHEGLTLAIVGRPNVGKSSLFNRLVERERAIVTATPGTTRDLVSESVAIGGIPIRLVDTAGMREAKDEVEQMGIQKSREALADADLVLFVTDASQSPHEEDRKLLAALENRAAIFVENKSDLNLQKSTASLEHNHVHTSALTGEGIVELRKEILRHVGGVGVALTPGFLTNARHQALVTQALSGLDAAKRTIASRTPHEMLLLDLYTALRPLDEITGATTADDILNLIFSRFCIGK